MSKYNNLRSSAPHKGIDKYVSTYFIIIYLYNLFYS